MKLTNKDILFIDRYLEQSGIKYADIRYEMTDHVATALEGMEGSFYENFKNYMLQHKKDLLDSGGRFSQAALKRAWKMMLVNLFKPVTLAAFILFYIILKAFSIYFYPTQILEFYSGIYVVLMIVALLYYKYFSTRYHKYSIIDKLKAVLFTTLYIVFVLVKPERIIANADFIIAYYSFLSAFFISIFSAYRRLINKYKLQYNDK